MVYNKPGDLLNQRKKKKQRKVKKKKKKKGERLIGSLERKYYIQT